MVSPRSGESRRIWDFLNTQQVSRSIAPALPAGRVKLLLALCCTGLVATSVSGCSLRDGPSPRGGGGWGCPPMTHRVPPTLRTPQPPQINFQVKRKQWNCIHCHMWTFTVNTEERFHWPLLTDAPRWVRLPQVYDVCCFFPLSPAIPFNYCGIWFPVISVLKSFVCRPLDLYWQRMGRWGVGTTVKWTVVCKISVKPAAVLDFFARLFM